MNLDGSDGHDAATTRIRVACLQMQPVFGDKAANLARMLDLIETAAREGADLVVLPELANSGYVFASREEAVSLAEPVPGGPTTDAWIEAAARHGLTLVAGITEIENETLFNSAVVIGPQGFIGVYRKMHLWDQENLYFERGNLGFPVFETPVGRIGVLICYDGWFPEAYRLLALQGADLVCIPTNWVPIPGQEQAREAMANILCKAAAHSNSVFVAAADRVGTERGQPFLGQSLIVGCSGLPLAGPASAHDEEIIMADLDLGEARRQRRLNAFNEVLRDRRSDVYAEMLGASAKPYAY